MGASLSLFREDSSDLQASLDTEPSSHSTAHDSVALVSALGEISRDSFEGDEACQRALTAARALVRRLETPVDTAWEMSFSMPALCAALKAARDNGVFDRLHDGQDRPRSTSELAPAADAGLMSRILRHLAAMNIIEEVDVDLWKGTAHTDNYRHREVFAGVEYADHISFDCYRTLPKYWGSVGYKPPESIIGSWQYLTGKDQLFYDWVNEHAEAQECFTDLMKGYASQRRSWVEVYPTGDLISTAEPEGPVVVDIGAGSGHDLVKFLEVHPETAGRLIFQDREATIRAASESAHTGLVPMIADFFDVQPVKGARAYFLHSIFHNWPDDQCRQILQNIKQAMRPRYSIVLINDMIIPTRGADRFQTSMDLGMASILNARERSEKEWTLFLGSAGFRVVKFWHHSGMHDGVIETVPADWDS